MIKNKLFITILIVSVSCNILSAQTSKGKFFIGADFSGSQNLEFAITQSKSDSDSGDDPVKTKSFSFDMMPKVVYFVIDNLALGLDFNLSSGFSKNTDDEFKYSSILLAAGPLIRYYIPTNRVIPFAEAYYSIGSYKGKSDYFDDENSFKYAVQYYGLGLGISIPLGEKVSFDALAGYKNSVTKEKEDNENNDRLVRGSYGFKLGFSVFLGSGKGNT